MVAVSFRAAHAAYLSMGVEPREWRRLVAEAPDHGGGLGLERLAPDLERPLATGAIEDEGRTRLCSVQVPERARHRVPGADDDALGFLIGELHRRVGRQVRGAHEA